jgi:hypothetical protein
MNRHVVVVDDDPDIGKEADPSRPKLIRTDRGVGYFLDAKVETLAN